MEASAIQAGPGLGRPRIAIGTPLLRLRSDQQLVALFREGNEEAFRVIHDRYRPRLLAYVRQMLPGRGADVEDALQDVFVRTYAGLRTSNRAVALRPWLYRVAHNRCIDELRRPQPLPDLLAVRDHVSDCDPAAETERRETLRRLVADIGRLPEQQRSALLMREMSGMAYADVADALDISVPAVKSLLVRARIGLAQAIEARDAACTEIRRELVEAHEEGVRPSWMARRHLRDCAGCRACRAEIRAQGRRVAALAPVGPLAALVKLFGIGTGAGGGTATAASAGGATAGAASGLVTVTAGHVATILAAAVVTAGGAVAVQQTVDSHGAHHAKRATQAAPAASSAAAADSTMRPPALIPAASAATHAAASPQHHASAAPLTNGAAHGQGRVSHMPAATRDDAATESTSSPSASTTCTPPPPTACTASASTTCSSSSSSTTSTSSTTSSSSPTATTPTTTTATPTSTTPATTPTTTTPSTTSSQTAPACSTTSPGSSSQVTAPVGTTPPSITQPAKPA